MYSRKAPGKRRLLIRLQEVISLRSSLRSSAKPDHIGMFGLRAMLPEFFPRITPHRIHLPSSLQYDLGPNIDDSKVAASQLSYWNNGRKKISIQPPGSGAIPNSYCIQVDAHRDHCTTHQLSLSIPACLLLMGLCDECQRNRRHRSLSTERLHLRQKSQLREDQGW